MSVSLALSRQCFERFKTILVLKGIENNCENFDRNDRGTRRARGNMRFSGNFGQLVNRLKPRTRPLNNAAIFEISNSTSF